MLNSEMWELNSKNWSIMKHNEILQTLLRHPHYLDPLLKTRDKTPSTELWIFSSEKKNRKNKSYVKNKINKRKFLK